jgi:tRNA pseudouridine32 synthase/23S rRNA pseudouridine746 synthase
MINLQACFTPFIQSTKGYSLPKRFTFPFCYEPHPLCLLAAEELQQKLENNQQFQQEFIDTGKMFGVLLVENVQGEIGYLCAYSGKLSVIAHANESSIEFVPPVFDHEKGNNFFHSQSQTINQLNNELKKLLINPQINEYQQRINTLNNQQNEQLEQHRNQMSLNRKIRKEKRSQVREKYTGDELAIHLKELAKQSVSDKNNLRDLKQYWQGKLVNEQQKLTTLTDEISNIQSQRKRLSNKLQKKLFKQYHLLNSAGVTKDLMELFKDTIYQIPPAGTGDCAAPKLLQYAFQNTMKPLAIAEFWWGKAPKSEIRQHKNFYGACSGKCQPILTHMLEGITLDENPLLINPAIGKELDIVYKDEHIVVVNKPNEFLSVPGKNIEDSVYLRIKQQFPQATGSLIVHRLDMSTSGLMVLALSKKVQKDIQQQFVKRSIKKRYAAILEGNIEKEKFDKHGEINLPLRGDLEDRPRQLVCLEQGKPSKTQWEVISVIDGKTKLYLYPETGRTHQLRVHCAHPQGLNMPILGDDLYGNMFHGNNIGHQNKQRLHLHAQMLTLVHPVSKKVMTFQVDEEF